MSKYIDLKDQRFGSLVAKEFIGGAYGEWICECDCGNTCKIRGKFLRNGYKTHCSNCSGKSNGGTLIDLTGQTFGQWKVIKYIGNSTWECKCSCGRTIKNITSTILKTHQTSMCELCRKESKMPNIKYDMTNEVIGSIKVIKYIGKGSWECQCLCGETIKVKGFNLRNAKDNEKDYMCAKCSNEKKRDDLTNKTFGNWHVDKYVGNGFYQCTCSCENKTVKNVLGKTLKSGASTSCGCMLREKSIQTKIKRYGDITVNTKDKNRTQEQILASAYAENLKEFIQNNFSYKPTLQQLANKLGITPVAVGRKIHKFEMEGNIAYDSNTSSSELELREIIKELWSGEILFNTRGIIGAYELDIYIPDKKLAIEFNGTYWHSTLYKNKIYHQDKTITCAKFGIRLIHIFEYEWDNESTKIKIINLLKDIIAGPKDIVYAKNCEVAHINSTEAKDFLEKYHIQGYANAKISLALKHENEIVSAMTFGKPRYNTEDAEFEIIRLVHKSRVAVVGGTEKLFKHFITEYNPSSIVTYTDITKFTGNVYTRLGFKSNATMVTSPGYIWYNMRNREVLSRYQTTKSKLVLDGLGTEDQTEDEIMESLGCIKVYNSGNLKLIWSK